MGSCMSTLHHGAWYVGTDVRRAGRLPSAVLSWAIVTAPVLPALPHRAASVQDSLDLPWDLFCIQKRLLEISSKLDFKVHYLSVTACDCMMSNPSAKNILGGTTWVSQQAEKAQHTARLG